MIDWSALLLVAAVAIGGAAIIVSLFATGIRFLSTPPVAETVGAAASAGSARDDEMDDVSDPTRPASATVGGVVCFVLAGLGVLYGVYLIIPALHG
ncbi:hypothetical protein [Naasia lichenicola]|uniref:Uncharacterized protein n=1 Tax=Naasia lichenicola TaxID=2565933 RepID=A0A4V3WTL0_9MICO|nr:hypothetical protein [Naasia lichenicola]THG32357.1 hypothetical protein E6C64_04895 [Naasia lichenicola]